MFDKFSLKNQSPEINLYARLVFWLFALLLLTKFSPIGAGLTVLVVAAQVFIGTQLLSSFRVTGQLSALSRIGLGFCLGVILSTLVYVLVVSVTVVNMAVCSQIVLLCLAYFAQRKLSKTDQLPIEPEDFAVVKWLAVAALLGLSLEWFWPLPVAVLLAIIFSGQKFFRSHSSAIRALSFVICSLIGVSIWLQILATRPNRPWFPDDRFAEIWSFSLGKWGLSHNPMLMGESISYHWFSFAWVGLLSNLTTVNIETSLALFAPVIVAVGCAVLGFSIVRSFVQNSLLAVSAIAVAFVVDTERFFRGFGFHAFQLSSFSQFFSLCLGLGVTLIVLKISLQNSLRNLILIALMLFGLIGSKISSAASLLCGLICVFVYQIFANKKSLRNSLVSVAVIIIVAILSFAFFLGNPGNRSASVIRRPGWTVGNIGDLIHVYNSSLLRYLPILIFLTLALGGLGFLTLFNVRNLSAKFGTQRVVGVYIIGCYMASLAQMWIAQADGRNTVIADADNTLYAFQFVSTISVIVGIAYTFAVFENSLFGKISKRLVLVFLLLTLSTVSLSRHWVIEYSGAYATPFLTSLRPALPFFIVLFLGVLFYYVLRSSKRFEFSKFIAVFSIGSLTIGGLYISAANYVSVASRQQAEWRSVDRFNEVRPEIVSAVGWLKKHSGQSEIIAMKGERRSIADLAYRRDFAGFPITIRLNGLNSNLENIKRDAINNFAKSGSCDSTQFLKNYGATLFLINITNSETPDMKRCADEVFRNKTIVIYSFNLS